MSNPYLQHLVSDRNFGYLFPHRLAIAAFGVANEYQLNKHRPRMVEGQHYVKIRGNDNVERLFYALSGLIILADLIATPQAQQFKADLIQHTQPAGAIVSAQPQGMAMAQPAYTEPAYTEPAGSLYTEAMPMHHSQVVSNSSPGYPLATLPPDHPIALLSAHLQPQLELAIERSVAARIPTLPSIPQQSPQDTASLIFAAQRVAGEQSQQTAYTLMEAQRLVADTRPQSVQINVSRRASSWLDSQDTWAMTLIATGIFVICSISAYALATAFVGSSQPRYQPQSRTL